MEEKPLDPKIESLLVEFLKSEEKQREKGLTIESLHKAMTNVADNLAAHEKKDDERHTEFKGFMDRMSARQSRHGRRLMTLEGGVKKVGEEVKEIDESLEETGRYELDQLRGAKTHWSRWAVATAIGFALVLVNTVIVLAATGALKK